jgi:long-chain acyl-CoA synthetase
MYQPRYTNLVTLFREACNRYGDTPAFGTREHDGWRWTTYREFAALVGRARAGLAALGIGPGDRVAVISRNRLEWAVCAYASFTRGAAYVPMYEAQLDRDWQYILGDSGAKLCFVSGDAVEQRVRALLGDLPGLQHVVDFDAESYRELLGSRSDREVEAALVQPDDGDLATLTYTSGTTGRPKGVRLTHANLAANASGLAEVAPVGRGERSLAFLPWAHVFGGNVELSTMLAIGGTLAICGSVDMLLDYLREVKPTMMFGVPRIWNHLYERVTNQLASKPRFVQQIIASGLRGKSKQKRGEPLALFEQTAIPIAEKLVFSKIKQGLGGKLRFAFSGAAALLPEVAEFIDNIGIEVYEGYGLTETSGCTTANLPGARKIGSVGRPLPGVEVRIDRNVPGAKGDEGEIIVYGTGVMAGYHNNPETTRATLTPDGGLRTGDLGRIDEDGYLYITGRIKEIYKLANGKYVAPVPLEEKLQLSPCITHCVLYGADQAYNVALIIPNGVELQRWARANSLPTQPEALLAHPRTRELIRAEIDAHSGDFKSYELVRDFILSDEAMTPQNDLLTPTLKFKRRNVYAKYESQLKALYKSAAA